MITTAIRNYIQPAFVATLLVLGLAVGPTTLVAQASSHCNTSGKVTVKTGKNCAQSTDQKTNLGNVIQDVTNVLLFIIGAVAVIMIIIGGLKYVLSNGDSAQITSAKNTILYAVIGIVVALLAYAIVNFVVQEFTVQNPDVAQGSQYIS